MFMLRNTSAKLTTKVQYTGWELTM